MKKIIYFLFISISAFSQNYQIRKPIQLVYGGDTLELTLSTQNATTYLRVSGDTLYLGDKTGEKPLWSLLTSTGSLNDTIYKYEQDSLLARKPYSLGNKQIIYNANGEFAGSSLLERETWGLEINEGALYINYDDNDSYMYLDEGDFGISDTAYGTMDFFIPRSRIVLNKYPYNTGTPPFSNPFFDLQFTPVFTVQPSKNVTAPTLKITDKPVTTGYKLYPTFQAIVDDVERIRLQPRAGTNINYIFDTDTNYTGLQLMSIRKKGVEKVKLDTNYLKLNLDSIRTEGDLSVSEGKYIFWEPPHVNTRFADSSVVVNLVLNNEVMITNAYDSLYPKSGINGEFDGFTYSGDTIFMPTNIQGHYMLNGRVSFIGGVVGCNYRFKVRCDGVVVSNIYSSSTNNSNYVTVNFSGVYLNETCDKVYITCTNLTNSNDITVTGSELTITPIHLIKL